MASRLLHLSVLALVVVPNISALQCPSRRETLLQGFGLSMGAFLWPQLLDAKVVPVTIEGPKETLGIQILNARRDDGSPIVKIQRVLSPKYPDLAPGMILKGYTAADDLVLRLEKGPFPFTLQFISDDDNKVALPPTPYTITTIQQAPGPCQIQSQRGDVLELEYEALYVANGKKVVYDSSSFRGTGQPYQMVLGSGDMIPGVDQGLVNMCPGEVRRLQIPPPLAYGPRARALYRIPEDFQGLEWTIRLVSIDGTIRAENNNQTRQERSSA